MSKGLIILIASFFALGATGLGVYALQRWQTGDSQSSAQFTPLTSPATNLQSKTAETPDEESVTGFITAEEAAGLMADVTDPLLSRLQRLTTELRIVQATPITENNYVQNVSQNLVDLSGVAKTQLIFAYDDRNFSAIGAGTTGQYLMSQGLGAPPVWTSLGTADPTSGNFSQMSVGTGTPFQVNTAGRLDLAYVGDSGYLSSSGGAIFIDNTNNTGTGLGIYSNAGGDALGNMINVKVDNALYNQAAFYMNYDGLSNAVEIVSNSQDSSSNALSVTGYNINDSTVGIIGEELGKGTLKISHYRPGSGNDQNASGISVDLKGVGTRAQGVYVDSTESGGTLGNLLRLRNESIDKFVVNYQGNLSLAGNITQGATGTDTTFTKQGNVSGDQFFVGTTGAFRVQRSAGNSEAFRVQVNGDSQGRWLGTSDGRLKWGDGALTQDVTLYRTGPSRLALEGSMTFNNLNGDHDSVFKGLTDSNLLYVDATSDNVGIGLSGPTSPLHISKSTASNATLLVNQTGAGDVFSAGVSGTPRFKILNTGDLQSTVGNGWRPTTDATNGLNIQNAAGTPFTYFDTTNNRVGIGTSAPGAPLHVTGGDIWLENTYGLRIKDSGGSARSVVNYTSGNNLQFYNYAATGVVQIGISNASNTGNIRFFTGANVEKARIDTQGLAIGGTTYGTSAANILAIASSTAPTTSITDGIQLFAVDVTGSHELRVRDEAGNVTTLSPHNFSLIPEGKSEDLAWAFYSERGNTAVNIDMTRTVRLVEELSGQQLIYTSDLSSPQPQTSSFQSQPALAAAVAQVMARQKQADEQYLSRLEFENHLSFSEKVVSIVSELVVTAQATFQQTTTFLSGVVFKGPLTVNNDTAGTVEIPAGATKIKVSFEQAFSSKPVVYLSPSQQIVAGYSLQAVTAQGFEVVLAEPQSEAKQLNWIAVMNQAGQGTKVEVLENKVPQPAVLGETAESPGPKATTVPSASPVETPLVSPLPTVVPSILPSPSTSTSADESSL